MDKQKCSIGIFKKEDCNILSYSRQSTVNSISEYTDDEKSLLCLRTECKGIETVCTYHGKKYLDKFSHLYGTSCCDPFFVHKKVITKTLRIITKDLYLKNSQLNLIPGKSLCSKCLNKIQKQSVETCEDSYDEIYEPECVLVESVNEACTALGVSPVKVGKLTCDRKASALKRKISKITKSATHKLNRSFDVSIPIEESSSCQNQLCGLYEKLIENLKERMKTAQSVQEKVNILSLLPLSWSCAEIQSEFGVSQYLVRKTVDLVKKHGVLPKVEAKQPSNILPTNVVKTVQDFYQDDDCSRLMPGKKDCISIRGEDGEKSNIQKRLILCDLKELYQHFKAKYLNLKIGFSKFAELRPKFCVLAGASGTHSVCVCLYHQNVKLMLSTIKSHYSYNDLLKNMVCDTENENCMLFGCSACPGTDAVLQMVQVGLEDYCDLSDEMQVSYRQWVSTDRCELTTHVLAIQDFLIKFSEKLEHLKIHHFIARKQAEYLKSQKEALNKGEFLVLGDFSENLSCVVQDEVQSYHWSGRQCTLHPFVIYWKKHEEIQTQSYCFVSDYLDHNTTAFYAFQKILIKKLKSDHPSISKLIYFSDGSAAQYKNKKNFSNLCHHEQDFGIKAEWHFFATSHGKGPCDGIGGTVKRLVRKASLQRPVSDQILNPLDVFEYCTEHIHGVTFFYVSYDDVNAAEKSLEDRYKIALSVPQTRSFHSYIPLSRNIIQAKQTSFSSDFRIFPVSKDDMNLSTQSTPSTQPKLSDYVCCIYDGDWWLGEVLEMKVYDLEEEYRIHFFHPKGPGTSFKKSDHDNQTWVRFQDVLKILTPAELWSPQGRGHNITPEMSEHLSTLLYERANH